MELPFFQNRTSGRKIYLSVKTRLSSFLRVLYSRIFFFFFFFFFLEVIMSTFANNRNASPKLFSVSRVTSQVRFFLWCVLFFYFFCKVWVGLGIFYFCYYFFLHVILIISVCENFLHFPKEAASFSSEAHWSPSQRNAGAVINILHSIFYFRVKRKIFLNGIPSEAHSGSYARSSVRWIIPLDLPPLFILSLRYEHINHPQTR